MGKFNDINIGDEVVILIPMFIKDHWWRSGNLKIDQIEIPPCRMGRTFIEELHYHKGLVIFKTRSIFHCNETNTHTQWILADHCAKVNPGFYEGMKFFSEEAKLA